MPNFAFYAGGVDFNNQVAAVRDPVPPRSLRQNHRLTHHNFLLAGMPWDAQTAQKYCRAVGLRNEGASRGPLDIPVLSSEAERVSVQISAKEVQTGLFGTSPQSSNNTSNNADTAIELAYRFCAFKRRGAGKRPRVCSDFRMPHPAASDQGVLPNAWATHQDPHPRQHHHRPRQIPGGQRHPFHKS